jgi:protein SCO1/2
MSKKILLILSVFLFLAIMFAFSNYNNSFDKNGHQTQTIAAETKKTTVQKQNFDGAKIGGAFQLVDHHGKPVTQDILKDHYSFIYFGFSHCPMICPTELGKIALVMDGIQNDDIHNQFQSIFITVDPDRDTPAVLKEYVEGFHPEMIGLTGTKDQIEMVKQAYKTYAAKAENQKDSGNKAENYNVDHSSFIYLMKPDGTIEALFKNTDNADYIIQYIKDHIL